MTTVRRSVTLFQMPREPEDWSTLAARVVWAVSEWKRLAGVESDRAASVAFGLNPTQLGVLLKRLAKGRGIDGGTLAVIGERTGVDGTWLLYGAGWPNEQVRRARESASTDRPNLTPPQMHIRAVTPPLGTASVRPHPTSRRPHLGRSK